eukprot:scaffold2205_cov183-Ochromonas_danica.AAC.4
MLTCIFRKWSADHAVKLIPLAGGVAGGFLSLTPELFTSPAVTLLFRVKKGILRGHPITRTTQAIWSRPLTAKKRDSNS